MKKIDIHCHVTNRPVMEIVPRSAGFETLTLEMAKYEIKKAVLLATYFPHKGTGISNFRLYDWIKDREEFLLFGSLDFQTYFYQGLNELNELAVRGGLKGIKIYTCYQDIDLKSEKLKQILDISKKFNIPLMFHTGYSHTVKRQCGQPGAITKLVGAKDLEFIARENPDVNIIASHMSKPFFDDLIQVVRRNPNVYTDTSGLFNSYDERNEIPDAIQEIRIFLENNGPDQLLFGTDFPIQTHQDSVYIIEEAMHSFSNADKKKVYYENARRLLENG